MSEQDEPLTELAQDQLKTGWVHFVCANEAYPALSDYVDESRGFPHGLTVRGIPPGDELIVANDGSGRFMLKLGTWRVSEDDILALQPFIEDDELAILTSDEWAALKPDESDDFEN